jgi:hypothetical protein
VNPAEFTEYIRSTWMTCKGSPARRKVRRSTLHSGPRPGFINAVLGIGDRADTALRTALATEVDPLVWRQIQLDARDALALGREEDSALLAWGAREGACRQGLAGLDFKRGFNGDQLAKELDIIHASKEPPYSFEEAIERMSGVSAVMGSWLWHTFRARNLWGD